MSHPSKKNNESVGNVASNWAKPIMGSSTVSPYRTGRHTQFRLCQLGGRCRLRMRELQPRFSRLNILYRRTHIPRACSGTRGNRAAAKSGELTHQLLLPFELLYVGCSVSATADPVLKSIETFCSFSQENSGSDAMRCARSTVKI